MSFKKQRLIIALVFLLIPMVSVFALMQSGQLSQLLFNFAIKMANIRTGLFIRANSWDINVFKFSASLKDIEVKSPTLNINSKLMQVKISPLMLLSGKLHLRELLIENSQLLGTVELAKRSPKKNQGSKKFSTYLSETLNGINAKLENRNISFEKFPLKNSM